MTNPIDSNEPPQIFSRVASYKPHRIGSHSDDWGGDSDKPCDCDKPTNATPTTPSSNTEDKEWIQEFVNLTIDYPTLHAVLACHYADIPEPTGSLAIKELLRLITTTVEKAVMDRDREIEDFIEKDARVWTFANIDPIPNGSYIKTDDIKNALNHAPGTLKELKANHRGES